MSDAITDSLKSEEKIRLSEIDVDRCAQILKELFPKMREYQSKKADLICLGYQIDERLNNLRIWKEI